MGDAQGCGNLLQGILEEFESLIFHQTFGDNT